MFICLSQHKPHTVNPLSVELNPICHLLALLGAHHIFHVSRLRVNTSEGAESQPTNVADTRTGMLYRMKTYAITLYVMQLSQWQNTVKSFQAHSHVKWFKPSKISESGSISIWLWRWNPLICQQHWVVHGDCVYCMCFFWSKSHSFFISNQLLFS